MSPLAFLFLTYLSIVSAEKEFAQELSSLRSTLTAEIGTRLLDYEMSNWYEDTDILMKYVKRQYQNLAYSTEDNNDMTLYVMSVLKNFLLEYVRGYTSDDNYYSDFDMALKKLMAKRDLSAVQLATPVRAFYDALMTFIDKPISVIQKECSADMPNAECQKELFENLSSSARGCNNMLYQVMTLKATLSHIAQQEHEAKLHKLVQLLRSHPEIETSGKESKHFNLVFDNVVESLKTTKDDIKVALNVRGDLYQIVKYMQTRHKFNCVSIDV